jgi:peptidoglycan/LPS O-acetylase OafA/YrhL
VPTDADMGASRPADPFRPDIEGLRGLAVLLVVGCHCGLRWCAGGFVGVDVFFVLSGYLITRQLAAEHRATSRIDLPRFFARRVRRLLPNFTLLLVAVTIAAALIFAPEEMAATGRAACAAALYVSNVFFDSTASDYFAPRVEGNPLLHTWSLGIEEQFYLVWPLLLLFAYRGAHAPRRSMGVLAGAVAASFGFCLYASHAEPTIAFFELPSRAWEFAAGGFLALAPLSWATERAPWVSACGIVGLAMILGAAALLRGGAGFPGFIVLLPVIGALAALFAGSVAPRLGIGAALSAAPLQFLGARSYSWYLWHWPFIVFAGVLFPDIAVYGKLCAAVSSLAVAALTYRLVEQPVRQSRYFVARPGLSLGVAGGAMALGIAASLSLVALEQDQQRKDHRFQVISAASNDIGDLPRNCFGVGPSIDVRVCEFGAARSPAIVLFGDSHAMQWFNPLLTAAKLEGWRLVTVLRAGCAASDTNPQHISATVDHCKQWRTSAIQAIIAMHPSAVVMASYDGVTLRGDTGPVPMLSADDIRLGTRRTLQALAPAGIPIIVLRDTPLPPFDIPACVARLIDRPQPGKSCDFEALFALNGAAYSAEQRAADGLTQIYFLDMNDLICPGKYCPATQDGAPIYRDLNHMTATFTETLAPAMRTRLSALLSGASSPAQSATVEVNAASLENTRSAP